MKAGAATLRIGITGGRGMTWAQRAIATALVAIAASWCGAALAGRLPPPAPRDRTGLALAERDLAWGERERDRGGEVWRRAALAHYGRAARGFAALGRRDRMAVALSRRARVHQELGELRAAATCLRRAFAAGFTEEDERLLALNRLGNVEGTLGEPVPARLHLEEALRLARGSDNRPKEAAALTNLAILDHAHGHPRRARQRLLEAIAIWEEVDAPREIANALNILAEFYLDVGRPPETLSVIEQMLAAGRADPSVVVLALRHRGLAELDLGDAQAARVALSGALDAARQSGNLSLEANVRNALGYWHLKTRDVESAAEEFRSALRLAQRSGDKPAQGNALANLAHVHDLLRREEQALQLFGRAEAIYEAMGDKSAVASVLSGRSLAERDLGRSDAVFASIERAVALVESVRGEAGGPSFRIPFLASRMDLYDLWIDQLMQRHRAEPLGGYDRRAFAVSERTRARALLEELAGGAGRPPPPLRPLTLPEIQRQVLDDESVLLAYSLGQERSYLWLVAGDAFRSHELPAGAEIEELAGEAHRRLVRSSRRRDRVEAEKRLAELSDLLLAPVADAIAGKRLVVVADGALHGLPFAALPEPRRGGAAGAEPLLWSREVVSLPSASLPEVLRRRTAGRPLAPRLVAVFAAPVGTAGCAGEDDLPPLHFAEEEAGRIRELVPAGASLFAVGAGASRQRLFRGDLGQHRIVHFATHACVDETDPDRSALVLSPAQGEGRRAGLVSAADLQRLDLTAELVVLSACRTAGTAVRGEGLVGLAWSVMQAGAPRVLVSLWPVDDQATADLMGHFYEALLHRGLSPPAALRHAQRRTAERWPSPFHWAGFTLYGEWRGFSTALNLPPATGSMSERAAGAWGSGDARRRQKGEAHGSRAEGGHAAGGGR
jgi:CHAT domain-containing protein